MPAPLLADAVVLAHFAFVAFVVAGGFVAWRWPRIAPFHLAAVAWASYVTLAHAPCPLTPLELALRRAAGRPGYAGGFVDHYIWPLMYPPGLTPPTQAAIGVALLALTVVAYAGLWRIRSRRACGERRRSSARRAR